MVNRRWAALLALLAAATSTIQARAQAAGERQATAGTAAVDPAPTYELAAVDVEPEIVNGDEVARLVNRSYPRELRRRHENGTVTLRFVVRSDGAVDSTRLTVEYVSAPGFADAALVVVRGMRFSLARVNGQPVPVWVTLPVQFWTFPRPAPPVWTPGSRP